MQHSSTYASRHLLNRRGFLDNTATGLSSIALSMMLAEQAVILLCQRIDGETGLTRLLQQIVGDQAHLLQEIQLS